MLEQSLGAGGSRPSFAGQMLFAAAPDAVPMLRGTSSRKEPKQNRTMYIRYIDTTQITPVFTHFGVFFHVFSVNNSS